MLSCYDLTVIMIKKAEFQEALSYKPYKFIKKTVRTINKDIA